MGYWNDCKVRSPIQSLARSDCNLCPGRRRAGSSATVVLQPISTGPLHLFVRAKKMAASLKRKTSVRYESSSRQRLGVDETQR